MCMCDHLYGYECVLWKELQSLVEAQICHLPTATLDVAMEGDSMNEDRVSTFAVCLAPTLHGITIGAFASAKVLAWIQKHCASVCFPNWY